MSGPRRVSTIGVSLKLYLSVDRSVAWAEEVARVAGGHPAVRDGGVRLFVLPSLPALPGVRDALAGTGIAVGAQDLWWEDRGAYTGAVSGADLAVIGATLVEVGHAERRRWFAEDDDVIGRKLAAGLRNGLTPVLCVGERTDGGSRAAVAECAERLDRILEAAGSPDGDLIVAYEPEWAIGAAQAASPEHVDAVCAGIRDHLAGAARIGGVTIIYGGSAGPGLLPTLGPAVDGLFLGRFAHDPAALGRVLDETVAVR